MCRSKPQQSSGKNDKQNNFSGENISSEQASPSSEMEQIFTKEHRYSMSETWEYISVKKCKVNYQSNRPSLEKQSPRGQKPTFGNVSTWIGVMLRTKAMS